MAYGVAVYNRKGGGYKSTGAYNIGASLALMGYKVLLVDGDSQSNLTAYFYDLITFEDDKTVAYDVTDEGLANRRVLETIYEVLEEDTNIYNAIESFTFESKRKLSNKFQKQTVKLDLLPGSEMMDYYSGTDVECLKKKLIPLQKEYDYIIIDFPPSHTLSTVTYLVASDYVIVPLNLGKSDSISGYDSVLRKIKEVRDDYGNKDLEVLGTFFTGTQLYKADQKALIEMQEYLEGKNLFNTLISFDYSSLQLSRESMKQPLCICCGSKDVSKEYSSLAKEIDERIKERGKK